MGLQEKIKSFTRISALDENSQYQDYVMLHKVLAEISKLQEQIQLKRDNALEWVKTALLDKEDFVDEDDFEGCALELCNAIQVFVNREVLALLTSETEKET